MEELRNALSGLGLDPEAVADIALTWSGRILAALAIFLVGRIVARVLTKRFRQVVARMGADETLGRFFGSVIYIVFVVLVAMAAVAALRVPMTSFLAILGAAGLAVGLALRDSLSNVAAGVLLVFLRPFKVGDSIEAAGVAGVVASIGIFDMTIKSPDNRVITVPNRLVYSGTIVNASTEASRRIDLVVPIGNQDDVVYAKELIRGILADDERVLEEPAAEVRVQDLLPANVNLAVGVWVRTYDYAAARGDLLERIKAGLREAATATQEGAPQPVAAAHAAPPLGRAKSRE
jgi:small conductance mechanosensitive channel